MIRINLLPVRQKRGHQSTQAQLWIGAVLLLATVLGCVFWAWSVAGTLENRKEQIQTKEQEKKRLAKQIREVKDLEDVMKELKEKLGSSTSSPRARPARFASWTICPRRPPPRSG